MNRYRIISLLCLSLFAPAALAGIAPNDAALILDMLLDMENDPAPLTWTPHL